MKKQRKLASDDDRKQEEVTSASPLPAASGDTHSGSFSTNSQSQSNDFELGLTRALGSMIGPYKLLEEIGEGGFGVVYSAEQREPIRRKVALKIIKPGMGTKEVIARFEAERQALTLMDHPHIARVIDAGATEAGQPFFVMELVHGISITEFCDRNKLDVKARLALFIDVCQAVQHAHQKGIIHRDIKPRNILVELKDTTPDPKIIDFGVAKATELQLTEHTIHTLQAQMIGTPLYMSPEQADKNALDVDTRSDIYSLGVMLYEMLTGTTPIDRDRLREANVTEFVKMICEEEPVRPSARISDSEDLASTISTSRRTEPGKLRQMLTGDLDWIVLKALEKDRTRRYQTARGFARDVERFLNDEPVSASPPSTFYRLHKFARRNKVGFAAGSVVAVALLAATIISLVMANFAIKSEETARLALESEQEKTRMLEVSRQETDAQFEKSLEILNEVMVQVGSSGLNDMPRMQLLRRDVLEKATVRYESIIDDIQWEGERYCKLMFDYAGLLQSLARIRRWVGANKVAVEAYQKGDDTLASLEGTFADHRSEINVGRASLNYGKAMALRAIGQPNEAENAFSQSIKFAKQATEDLPDKANFELCRALNQLGYLLAPTNRWKEAEPIYRESVDVGSELSRKLPDSLRVNSELARAMHNLAIYLRLTRRPDESEKYFRETLSTYRRLLDHEDVSSDVKSSLSAAASDFAIFLDVTDKPEEATELRAEALAISRDLVADYPAVPLFQRGLAIHLGNTGLAEIEDGEYKSGRLKYEESEQVLRDLISQMPENLEIRGTFANQLSNHGECYAIEKDFDSAESFLEQSVKEWRFLAEKQPDVANHKIRWAQTLRILAVCKKNSEEYQAAVELGKEALSLLDAASGDPNSAEYASDKANVWYQLALVHGEHLGNEQQAIEAIAKAVEFVELAKGEPALTNRLHCLYLASSLDKSLNDPKKAIELSEHFIDELPDATSHLILGIAQFRNGDFENSLATLKKSRDLETKPNVWTRFYTAMALHHLKKEDEARSEISEAQELLETYDFESSQEHESRRLKSLAKEAATLLSEKTD